MTERQEGDLEHDGEGFYRNVEIPCRQPGRLPMLMPTSLCKCPSHPDLIVPDEPLFSGYGEAEARTDTARMACAVH